MSITRTVNCTLLVSESNRYPYLKARLAKSSATARAGEVAVPLSVTLDVAWFRKRAETQHIQLPPPPNPTVETTT
jgi:hypothetical protein